MTLGASILPAWLVFPIGGALMVVLAGHLIALRKAEMPESRRRIRTANSWVMLAIAPLVAVLFGYASPLTPKLFVLSSSAVISLVGAMVLLAIADMMNNARLARVERRQLDREIARVQAEAHQAIRDAQESVDAPPTFKLPTERPSEKQSEDPG